MAGRSMSDLTKPSSSYGVMLSTWSKILRMYSSQVSSCILTLSDVSVKYDFLVYIPKFML